MPKDDLNWVWCILYDRKVHISICTGCGDGCYLSKDENKLLNNSQNRNEEGDL